MNTNGPLIRRKRRELGISLNEFARKHGISAHTLSVIETGKRDPRLGTLRTIADGLGCSVADLIRTEVV